jgi:hypothetical protein
VTGDWRDLSDAELRVKLRQRNVAPEIVATLVRRRDWEQSQEVIDRLLDDDNWPLRRP